MGAIKFGRPLSFPLFNGAAKLRVQRAKARRWIKQAEEAEAKKAQKAGTDTNVITKDSNLDFEGSGKAYYMTGLDGNSEPTATASCKKCDRTDIRAKKHISLRGFAIRSRKLMKNWIKIALERRMLRFRKERVKQERIWKSVKALRRKLRRSARHSVRRIVEIYDYDRDATWLDELD